VGSSLLNIQTAGPGGPHPPRARSAGSARAEEASAH